MNFKKSIIENRSVFITLVILIGLILFVNFRITSVEKNGVITLCKIDWYEPLADGSTTYCSVFLNDKVYKVESGMGYKSMIGRYYFVKVLKENPNYEIIIYDNIIVPSCILKIKLPSNGWKEIPKDICK